MMIIVIINIIIIINITIIQIVIVDPASLAPTKTSHLRPKII